MSTNKKVPQVDAAAAAEGTEIRLSAAPIPPSAPQAAAPVRSLDDVDWMNVDSPAPVTQETAPESLLAKMGHDFLMRIPVDSMAAWRAEAKFDILQYAACHPIKGLGVVVLAPCEKGDEHWTTVRPDGNAAHVKLREGLASFGLTWPKDQNIVFPVLIRETKWGWSLILNVAGRGYETIKPRTDDKNKGKGTKS